MARTDSQCKQRNGNPKKEPKRNSREQKHWFKMKNASDYLINRLDTGWGKNLWTRGHNIKILANPKAKRIKTWGEKHGTQYAETMGQLQ